MIFVTGASGIIAQIVLIRELLVTFYGNELSIGLVLANWLILEAIGSFLLGKTIERVKNKIGLFSSFVFIFSVALPMMIYFARILKNIIGAAPGEILNTPTMFLTSFLILLPLACCHGALFTFGAHLFAEQSQYQKSVGRVYVLETCGTIAGGVLLPYLLLPYFSPFAIAFIIGITNLAWIAVLIFFPFDKRKVPLFLSYGGAIVLLGFFLFGSQLPQKLQGLSLAQKWRGYNVVYSGNSKYGNITVVKRQEQYTFFEDGIPVINIPIYDIGFAEDFVHLSLLSHPNPQQVLIIGGASGGILNEILKHPIQTVYYVELDPLLIQAIQQFPTPITSNELTDQRVRLIQQDARLFLKTHQENFDLILVNLLAPATLQLNRFFTKEFFALAKARLNPKGMVASISYGSSSYLSAELKRIIVANWLTLKSVFSSVFVIPGDFNLFLAGDSLIDINSSRLISRLSERKIETHLITPEYLTDRLSEYKYQWFWSAVGEKRGKINSDFAPHAVFDNFLYWSALTADVFRNFLKIFQSITIFHFISIFGLVFILAILLSKRLLEADRRLLKAITFALFSTGFAGMVLNLVITLAFQSVFGYVYHQISILITAFIAGTAIGGGIAIRLSRIGENSKRQATSIITIFLLIESCLFLIGLGIPFILIGLGANNKILFPILSVLVGGLLGMEFPLANTIYVALSNLRSASSRKPVGLLYASDLAGGFLGALFVSVILIPILGITLTALVASLFKLTSILLILFSRLTKSDLSSR